MHSKTEVNKVFNYQLKIRFHDADPAGILFFGNILPLTHSVFEEFLASLGISWNDWFKSEFWGCPIRNSNVDYLGPIYPGETYRIEVRITDLSQSSFVIKYDFINSADKLCAQVKLVQTFIDMKTFKKIQIPEKIRILFETVKN